MFFNFELIDFYIRMYASSTLLANALILVYFFKIRLFYQ